VLSHSSGGVAIFSRHHSGPLYKHPAMQSVPPSQLNAFTYVYHGSLVNVQARWVWHSWFILVVHAGG
jgi:hypothetical protein